MRSDFSLTVHNGIESLVYLPWWEAGVLHGMTTRQLSLVGSTFEADIEVVRTAVGASHAALPQQCHGAEVLDLREHREHHQMLQRHGDLVKRYPGDAIAAPRSQVVPSEVIVYGVLTADCVPIIVRGSAGYALIHAGWRGLANGVIAAGVRYVGVPDQALVFACAGPKAYEVGDDVVDAVGSTAVYRPREDRPGKHLFDTVATSIKQLRHSCGEIAIEAAEVCTITDHRFHSHRRDAGHAGRCLTWIVPPQLF